MSELVEYIELSRRTGIGIVSIAGGSVDLSTAEGRFQAHIFGAVAAAEREKTQERIKRKHPELAQTGAWPGRRVYGYRADAVPRSSITAGRFWAERVARTIHQHFLSW